MNPAFNPTRIPAAPSAASPALRERDDRLAALQSLAGQLAHDFNNFLAPVLGYVSLIKEELPPDSPALQYANALEKAARKTEATLDTILLATRPQRRFRPQSADLQRLVDKVLTDWTQALPTTARITVKQQLCPCRLPLDESLWRNAIKQLLNNVRFALATGGILRVSLEPAILTLDQAQQLGIAAPQTYCLTFQDNGFGMSETARRRAFEPFFTSRPRNQAQGLGLSIVYGVVRLHGGQVILESTEDTGTTVKIWLPSDDPDTAPVAASLRETPPKTANPTEDQMLGVGKRVLIVDDDPMVIEVVRASLQRARFEVLVARDGQEGLELFQQNGKSLELIITDVTMPRMSGIEMVQKIRWLDPAARLILMSGDADATREEKLALLAPQRPPLIKKPFTLKDLMAVIRTQLT
jgi:CheY-like chemotaxis protein